MDDAARVHRSPGQDHPGRLTSLPPVEGAAGLHAMNIQLGAMMEDMVSDASMLAGSGEAWGRSRTLDPARIGQGAIQGAAPTLPSTSAFGRAAQRAADLCLATLLLVFFAPFMALTALAIRLDSRGPVLYRQERVGLHGRVFTLIKFRSMRVDAERDGPVWAAVHDTRVTRVGRHLRRMRIDELPQLYNVIAGTMSLVGPRPERPHFVERLAEAIPHYNERCHVKPGVTGWAQINYRYGASVEDARIKLSYDLHYVQNRTLLMDLVILFLTVRVVLFQEGSR